MTKIENQCSGCPKEMCMGSSCPFRNVEVAYCDICGEEIYGDVYFVDDEDVCEDCLKDKFRKGV